MVQADSMQLHQQHQKQDFSFDPMLHMTDDSFNLDMIAFTSKTPQPSFYDLNPYMRAEQWSNSSPAESAYASPIDCSRPMPGVMNGGEQLLSTSHYNMDVPNYVRFPYGLSIRRCART